MFFLPERVLPDVLYTTLAREMSIELQEFQKYRIKMSDADSTCRMYRIIQDDIDAGKSHAGPIRDHCAMHTLLHQTMLDLLSRGCAFYTVITSRRTRRMSGAQPMMSLLQQTRDLTRARQMSTNSTTKLDSFTKSFLKQ
jgi:hypothetical protein